MNVVLFVLSYFLTVAGAFNIAFPPSPPAETTFAVAWSRDKDDPNVQFYLQKIKLDDPDGPTPKSTPVPVDSGGNSGISPIFFNRAGLFEILAVNIQNGQPFYTTEVTVVTNPTSTGGSPTSVPTPAIPPADNDDNGNGNGNGNNGGNNGNKGGEGSIDMGMNGTSSANSSSTTPGSFSSGTSTSGSPASASANEQESKTDKAPSSNSAVIIGTIVGVIGVLFIIAAVLLCIRYRRRRQTTTFERAMMVRSPGSVLPWVAASGTPIQEKDLESFSSSPSLSPQIYASDSLRAKATYRPPILTPPARSVISEATMSSVSTSSACRVRERNTPRLSTSTYTTTTSEGSSLRLFPLPALPPRTRTDRQMRIEEEIQGLQARMIFLQGRGDISPINRTEREEELRQMNGKVERLKQLHESKWALGLTDDPPSGLA